MPCPDEEWHDAIDWMWRLEKVGGPEETAPVILNEKPLEMEEPVKDIVFEIDRLVNVVDGNKGPVTIVDTDTPIPDENGPDWERKQERILKKQLKAEKQQKQKTEDRTDQCISALMILRGFYFL